ncbi:hypothetical protein [Streptomyces sp. NBC_00872]|uniref:hypothetical protein n=1 Tax=Streptomyces sp. NBC_00872 TaxID=2903686 RepID=UPI003870B0F9|nr:SMI1/KNR4 family protein [Streptomyces sp. NBC_00872]
MISLELRQAFAVARDAVRLEPEWAMMNSIPEGVRGGPGAEEVPGDYLEFLSVANGAIFGRIVIFDAATIGEMQFYADETEGAPVRLGRESWFCFGKVNDDPLFISRRDGSVWGFPDMGIIWWQSDIFERLAGDLDEFLLRCVFGRGYLSVSGASEGDQWWRLLTHTGSAE